VIIRKWNIGDVYIFNLNEDTTKEIAECICGNIALGSFESQKNFNAASINKLFQTKAKLL
jgi:hypothetical protein